MKGITYTRRRSDGLCVHCGKQRPAPGYAACNDCLEKRRKKYHEKQRKKHLARLATYREKEKDERQKSLAPLEAGQRRCHDCGAPTWDYRCEKCRDKWRRKHGVATRFNVEDGDGAVVNL